MGIIYITQLEEAIDMLSELNRLELRIEQMRHAMIYLGNKKGINEHEVIKLSQELDKILNEYQQLLFLSKQHGCYQ